MARDKRTEPLVTPSSALIEQALTENAGSGKQGRVVLVSSDAEGANLRVEWGVPKESASGKSYLVTYDSVKAGSMRIAVTATIPLGKDKARAKRETNAGDAGEFTNADAQAALRFFRSGGRL